MNLNCACYSTWLPNGAAGLEWWTVHHQKPVQSAGPEAEIGPAAEIRPPCHESALCWCAAPSQSTPADVVVLKEGQRVKWCLTMTQEAATEPAAETVLVATKVGPVSVHLQNEIQRITCIYVGVCILLGKRQASWLPFTLPQVPKWQYTAHLLKIRPDQKWFGRMQGIWTTTKSEVGTVHLDL